VLAGYEIKNNASNLDIISSNMVDKLHTLGSDLNLPKLPQDAPTIINSSGVQGRNGMRQVITLSNIKFKRNKQAKNKSN
jgi:hypothetical protein